MNKYSLIIIDDENIIAQGLKKLILQLKDPQIYSVYAFEKPQRAREYALKNPPDILFTDIKMPGLSGLDLAKELHQTFPGMLVIILSGYDDFSLVREALRIGCHDYLRKPATSDEIKKVLHRAIGTLNQGKTQVEGGLKDLELLHQRDMEFILYHLYIDGTLPQNKISLMGELGYSLFPGNWFTLLLGESCSTGDHEILEKILEKYIPENMININRYHIIRNEPLYRNFSLISGNSEQVLINFQKELQKDINLKKQDSLIFSSSKVFQGLDNLTINFKDLQKVQINKIIYSEHRFLSPLTIPYWENSISYTKKKCGNELLYQFEYFLNRRDRDSCLQILNKLFHNHSLENKQTELIYLKELFTKINRLMGEILRDKDPLMDMENYFSTAQILNHMIDQVGLICCQKNNREHSIVKLAKDYVRENYDKPIDMNILTESLEISYSYFSTLFKSSCHISFQNYLMEYRMKIAGSLLLESSLSIQEIAARVGYQYARHFTRAFKKYHGSSPSQYRVHF